MNYSLDSFLGPKTWDSNNNRKRSDLDDDFRINEKEVSDTRGIIEGDAYGIEKLYTSIDQERRLHSVNDRFHSQIGKFLFAMH